jgi:ketosteroid isomerase-like protein
MSSDAPRDRTIPQLGTTGDEILIRALLEAWADAVRRHDVSAIVAHHEPDVLMFDVPPPLQCKGIEEYKQTWDLLFRYHKPGAAFDIQELAVTAGHDVAFAVAIMRCGPDSSSDPADKDCFLFRLTVGLRKVDGNWRIVPMSITRFRQKASVVTKARAPIIARGKTAQLDISWEPHALGSLVSVADE